MAVTQKTIYVCDTSDSTVSVLLGDKIEVEDPDTTVEYTAEGAYELGLALIAAALDAGHEPGVQVPASTLERVRLDLVDVWG